MFDFSDFISDFVAGPLLDLSLCRFDFKIWGRHQITTCLLLIPMLLFGSLLAVGIMSCIWILAVIGVIGLLVFGYLDVKYTIWWIREGRFGWGTAFMDDIPILDEIPIPKGDFTDRVSQEEQLRGKLEDSHRCLNSRM